MNNGYEAPALGADRISPVAVIALILAIATVPGVFCCYGFFTGPVALILGIVAVVQQRQGNANAVSGWMGWLSIAISGILVLGHIALFGLGAGLEAFEQFQEKSQEVPATEVVVEPPG